MNNGREDWIIADSGIYREVRPRATDELKKLVLSESGSVFGESALYFNIRMRVTEKLHTHVAEGLLLDLKSRDHPQIWTVHYVLSSLHDERRFRSEIVRFDRGIRRDDTIHYVKDTVAHAIMTDHRKFKRFEELVGGESDIYHVLNKALRVPGLMIVLDEFTRRFAKTISVADLRIRTRLVEFRTFKRGTKRIHMVGFP